MIDSLQMEYDDLLKMKDAEIFSLREELDSERRRRESAEHDAHLMSVSVTKAIAEFAKFSPTEQKSLLDTWAKNPIYPK
jgi:hypothetical protein